MRWVPHNQAPADMLTKLFQAHEEPLIRLLRTNKFRIECEAEVLSTGPQHQQRRKIKCGQQNLWEADKVNLSPVDST